MSLLTVVLPVLRVLFERFGKPEIDNLPALLFPGGKGAVIACNHVGWADTLWMGYAIYPRQLHHLSKQELFQSPVSKWFLMQCGAMPIDRAGPSPSVIKGAVKLLSQGEVLLIFPNGTRSQDNIAFKRGAATIGLHAQVPIIPAYYDGPTKMMAAHLMNRPSIKLRFGLPVMTVGLPINRAMSTTLTERLQYEVLKLSTRPEPTVVAVQ